MVSVGHKYNLILIEIQCILPFQQDEQEEERSIELFCTVGGVFRVPGSAREVSQCNGEMLWCTACALTSSECTGKQGSLGSDGNVL